MIKALILLFLFGFSWVSSAQHLVDKYVTANGHKMHYFKVGSGKPLVILTGASVTNYFWSQPFINCLAHERTLYLFSYQGINTGEPADPKLSIAMLAKDIDRAIKKLGIHRPEILGWSMGGGVALTAAVTYPDDFSALDLLSPILPNAQVYLPVAKHKHIQSPDGILNEVLGNNIYGYKSEELPKYKDLFLSKNKQLFADRNQNKLEFAAIQTWAQNEQNLLRQLKILKLPIQLIAAENDTILNAEAQLAIFKDFPNIKKTLVRNSGHAAFHQYPQKICHMILQ